MNSRPVTWAVLAALLLAGCQSAPTIVQGETGPFRERAARLADLDSWQVTGRIAFKLGDEGGTGAMTWKQQEAYLEFSFRGPLGAASFNIAGSPPQLLLETGDGEPRLLHDPDTEMRERFGWSAPFESLRFWMVGMPDPYSKAELRVDEQGLLREISQAGWAVSYDRYHSDEPRLPRKLTILRDDLRLRVIVDRWQLLQTGG